MISANIESCFEKTRKRETDKKKASCDKKLKVTKILANQPTNRPTSRNQTWSVGDEENIIP